MHGIIHTMLLAYIDEVGEPGAFVNRADTRYNTSPAFGYAGFIIPEQRSRSFGAHFVHQRNTLFSRAVEAAEHPGRWERKGADVFRPDTADRFPQHLRVFDSLVARLRSLDGRLFYYADEKALGTPRQTRIEAAEREMAAMAETLNRIARHADSSDSNVMVIIDQVNEKTRAERLPKMYSHILGRSADHAEMRRIIEPPMHVDSVLSANIQFADWIAAFVSRAIDYQLLDTSRFAWISDPRNSRHVRGSFTYESKLHLWQRSIADLHHSQILDRERRLHPAAAGQLIQRTVDPAVLRRIKAAAERDHKRP